MTGKYKQFETAVIHEGYDSKKHLGSLATPLFQTSTFTFENAEQGERRFRRYGRWIYIFTTWKSNGTGA